MVSTNESERLEQVFNLQDVGERQDVGKQGRGARIFHSL